MRSLENAEWVRTAILQSHKRSTERQPLTLDDPNRRCRQF